MSIGGTSVSVASNLQWITDQWAALSAACATIAASSDFQYAPQSKALVLAFKAAGDAAAAPVAEFATAYGEAGNAP